MKTMNKIILLTASAALLVSCDMTRYQIDEAHPENFFKDAASLQSWMNYCYSEFDSQESMLLDADDFVCANPSPMLAGTRTPETQTWDWTVLAHINRYYEFRDFVDDEEAVARFDAEADFFRALFYFNKVRMFGDVPYSNKAFAPGENVKALPRDYVMTEVLDGFRAASEELADAVQAVPVAINKWVALGFLARAALFEGTFMKYYDEPEWEYYLEEAVKACEEIMESGLFKVYSGPGWKPNNAYRNLFAMETMSPEEALLVRLYNTSDCTSRLDYIYNDCRLGATARFVNHYQIINGRGIQDARPGYETETESEVGEARDPRLAQTILLPGCRDLETDEVMVNDYSSMTGYAPIKFRKSKDASKYGCCFPILRYPEILLIYAEAKAELGTLTQADLDRSVNLIRARVGMPAISLLDTYGGADSLMERYYPGVPSSKYKGVILEIRRERTIELALEGHRQWDIIRWNEGSQIGNWNGPIKGAYVAGKGSIVAFEDEDLPETEWNEDRDCLWPVPASEFTVDGCRLIQNYGY